MSKIKAEITQFIHFKLNGSEPQPTAPRLVAFSANFEPSLVESARQAVFLGRMERFSGDFHGAFALGQTESSAGKQLVFTRFLPDKQSSGHVSLYEHHLLLTWEQFLALGGNIRSLANYFYRSYPGHVARPFREQSTLCNEIEVTVPPENVRLAALCSRLQPVVDSDFVIKLLLALFEAQKVSINGFPRTDNAHADEKRALDVIELLSLLLPLSWRPHLTFATGLFEAERSPARLTFELTKTDQIRVNFPDRQVWRGASPTDKVWPVYIEEVVTLWDAQAFDELTQYIAQMPHDAQSQLGTSHQAMRIYRLWEPITEKRFLSPRIEKNQLTPQRWLYLLSAGSLQAQEKAKGLASLTKTMLAGHLWQHKEVIPRYISDADATIYRAEVRSALPQASQQAQQLFQTWLQLPAFRELPACREVTCDLVETIAQHDLTQALEFVASIWHTFPPVPPVSRSALFAACVRHATTIEEIKPLILWHSPLRQVTHLDIESLHQAPALNQLPLTKRLIALLAGTKSEQPKTSWLYDAYRQEWSREPRFLFGMMSLMLDFQPPDFHLLLWDAELVPLAQQASMIIAQSPSTEGIGGKIPPHRPLACGVLGGARGGLGEQATIALLTRLLDSAKQLGPASLTPQALPHYIGLACLLDRGSDGTIALLASLSNTLLTPEWLAALHILSQTAKDASWKEAQVQKIITDPKWYNRPTPIRFDDCLRVADTLEWSTMAYPAIKQAIQLLQDAGSELTIIFPRSQQLLDWLLQHDPTNTAFRQLLIRCLCWDALRGDVLWSEVTKRLFIPPTSSADLAWFRENLQALLGLTLSDRIRILKELDEEHASTISKEMRAILDDAVNRLHAGWLLDSLQGANPVTHLLPLRHHRPPEEVVQLVEANCYAQPIEACRALLEWDTRWQGFNWLANTQVGLTFLANVIQSANQEGFIDDETPIVITKLQLISRLKQTEVRQHLFGVCSEPLTDALYQAWSWSEQNNKRFKELIEKMAEIICETLDSTLIAILGERRSPLDPSQLYVLLQTCFQLWEDLHKRPEAKQELENKLWRRYFPWCRQPSPAVSQEFKPIYASLRPVWMASIDQLYTQRQQLPESCKDSIKKPVFNITHELFRQAGQAYGSVFKEPTDLNKFVRLALRFALLHSLNSTADSALSKNISNLLAWHHQLIKDGNDLNKQFDKLLMQTFYNLLNEGAITVKGITAKSYQDQNPFIYDDCLNEAIHHYQRLKVF